ncbi:MAG: BACON domain-containing protein [Alistipes sp.]|nr:BACON domain-containing protein [Alistipes sp.]
MKKFFSVIATFALLIGVGCEKKGEDVVEKKSEFKLETSTVTVDAEGGNYEVNYTIINPVAGAVVLSESQQSWITNLSTATEGKISFSVDPNFKKESRSARIAVHYTAVEESYEINVIQAESTTDLFTYEIVETLPTSLTINVTPADVKSPYICRIYTKAHIDAFDLNSDDALTYYDLSAIGDEATAAGQTLLNYLQNIAYIANTENITFEKLVPNTEYVIYCYHINLVSGEAASEVYRQVICTTQTPSIDEAITMSFAVDGAYIQQTVTTKYADTYYYTECWSVRDFKRYYGETATPEEVFPRKWNEQASIKLNSGYDPAQILAMLCYQGSQDINYTSLLADTEYIFYVFAVSPETSFTASDIVIENVTTGSIEQSDMTIDIVVKDIYANTANVYWTASDPEGRFARSVFKKTDFDALGETDAEKFATIAEKYDFYQAVGYTDMNLSSLEANTHYVAFAYGLEGNTPNTRIFTTEFMTRSNTPGMSDINISWTNHYDLFDLSMEYPDYWSEYSNSDIYTLLPMTISGVSSSDNVYLMITTLPLEWYSKDAEWLRDVANDKYLVNCYSHYNAIVEYEKEYSIIAVAEDANGNYGKLFKDMFILYFSDAADTSSYVYSENK